MKTYDLKVQNVIVRFDDVGNDVDSPLFETLVIKSTGQRVLLFERVFRKSVKTSDFGRILASMLDGELGDEIERLRNAGFKPVIYLGFCHALISGASFTLRWPVVRALSRANRGFLVAFPSEGKALFQINIPSSVIRLADRYGFTIEM